MAVLQAPGLEILHADDMKGSFHTWQLDPDGLSDS